MTLTEQELADLEKACQPWVDMDDPFPSGPFDNREDAAESYRVRDLIAEVRRCRDLIQQVEFVEDSDWGPACPWCRSKAHAATCPAFGSEA